MTSPFPDTLEVRVMHRDEVRLRGFKRQQFVVLSRFRYRSAQFGEITVPPGFQTDFASVPTFAKSLVDDDDPDILYPSLAHDILYARKGLMPGRVYTRLEADQVLREAMRSLGTPAHKAQLVFLAVRLGGGRNWKD